jgi:hypothetical protein
MAGGGLVVADIDLNEGRAQGWPEIAPVIEALLIDALRAGARRIVLLDPDFVHWPLSSPALLDALRDWGRLGARRLELAAPDWQACARRHARLLNWRKGFDHFLDIRAFDPNEAGPDWPTALLAVQGGVCLRVLELEQGRARWTRHGPDRQAALELFDAIAQRSTPAWPLTTLGL